jgi:plastocyanin
MVTRTILLTASLLATVPLLALLGGIAGPIADGQTAAVAAAAASRAPAPATAPAPTAPTTPGFDIRGTVSIEAGIQQPDVHRAVVYLESSPELDAAPLPQDHYTVAQQNKQFVPNFIVIPRNAPVEFPNFDPFDHNVFSRSAAAPAFDLDRYKCGCSKTRVFDKVGVVQVFCNIHPFMRAFIVVTPNRYAARVEANGSFAISGVPAGTYGIVAAQDQCDPGRQTIEVSASTAPLAFRLIEAHRQPNENAGAGRGSYGGVERGLGVKRERLNLPIVGGEHPSIDPPPNSAPDAPSTRPATPPK